MERDALPQGQGAGSVTQVVEANLYRETSLLEKSPKRAHPANQEVGPSRKPDSTQGGCGVYGCRLMSENALWKRSSGGVSSRRVDLSRTLLGSVGVKSGVKARSQVGGLQYTGMSPAIMTGHTGSLGMYAR